MFFSCDSDCETLCTSGCTQNCNAGCDEGCTTGCTTSCDGNCVCNGCPVQSSCNQDCQDGCTCFAGYYGTPPQINCQACASGSYAPRAGMTSCTPCSNTKCGEDQYLNSCGGTNAGACASCPNCALGSQRVGCSGQSTGSCQPCPTGTYQDTATNQPCKACGACSPGFKRVECAGQSPGRCDGVPCAPLASPTNGGVSVSNGGVYPAVASFSCAPGYQLSGPASLSCTTSGGWSAAPPTCEPVPCHELSPPANGQVVTTNNAHYPSTATYACDPGFTITSSAPRRCRTDGSWDGSAPSCTPITCQGLGDPAFGSVSVTNGGKYPATALYTCDPGYAPSHRRVRACQPTGAWNDTAPACQGIPCIALDHPDNGAVITSNNNNFPSTAAYSCARGFELVGQGSRTCQTTGQWSGTVPTCQGVLCNPLPSVANGAVDTSNAGRYPSTATYSCLPGYTRTAGQVSRTCQTNASWTGQSAVCSACPVNQYQAITGDKPCAPCPGHSSTLSQSAAAGCQCDAGFGSASSSFHDCTPCPQGFIKPDPGNTPCTPCPAGFTTEVKENKRKIKKRRKINEK